MIYRYMNCSTDGYFARGRHSHVVLHILPHGTNLRVVRIGAWCAFSRVVHSRVWYAFSRVVRILARGAHSRAWYAFSRVVRIGAGCAFSRVVRIGAWCVFSPMVRILARGTYLHMVRLAAAFEDRAIGDPAPINIGSVR